MKIHKRLLARQLDLQHDDASSLEEATPNTQVMHNKCVSTSSTGAILSRSKSTTQSSVARPLSQSFAPLARVHTGPDSHTRTHPRVAWQPRSIVFLFWQPWSRKALDYPGIFKHCRINGYNLPQRKQITELRPNQSLSSPVPAPGIVGIKQALLRMSALGAFHIPQPGGSEFFWMQSPVWPRPPPWGLGLLGCSVPLLPRNLCDT